MENEAGQWFILNTLTQYERRVRDTVQRQIELQDPSIPVYEVQFPTEKTVEVKNGVRRNVERKFFPGYVFVRMDLYGYDEEGKKVSNENLWRFITGIKGVSRIGGVMSREEVEQWITLPGEEDAAPQQAARPKFNVGDEVEIVDGPIRGVRGNVKEIDVERGIITVEIMVFARLTQMELEFWQVEKVVE